MKGVASITGAVLLAAMVLAACSASTPQVAPASFSVEQEQLLVSGSGQWEVTLTIQNTGGRAAAADCNADLYDQYGALLAETLVPYTTPSVAPGATFSGAWMTGLTPGANQVAKYRVICTPETQ